VVDYERKSKQGDSNGRGKWALGEEGGGGGGDSDYPKRIMSKILGRGKCLKNETKPPSHNHKSKRASMQTVEGEKCSQTMEELFKKVGTTKGGGGKNL